MELPLVSRLDSFRTGTFQSTLKRTWPGSGDTPLPRITDSTRMHTDKCENKIANVRTKYS
eukprot:5658935-Amphidinium_carterae.1